MSYRISRIARLLEEHGRTLAMPIHHEWATRAACHALPPALVDQTFYPDDVGRESTDRLVAREDEARSVCAACPVQVLCLVTALARNERWGIWGGTNRSERDAILTELDKLKGRAA